MLQIDQLMCDPKLKSFIINKAQQPLGSMSQMFGLGSYGSVELLIRTYQLKRARNLSTNTWLL